MRVFILSLTLLTTSAFASSDKSVKEVFAKKAALTNIKDSVIYPAEVKSRVYSEVKSQIDGIVKEIYFTLGSKVKFGEKVLSLSNQDLTLNFTKNRMETPVTGVLSKMLVRKGSYVARGQTLFVITEPSEVFVSVEVPVKDLDKLQVNHKAKLNISTLEKEVGVKLVGKGSVVNKTTGTVTCEFSLDKKENILPGLLGRVELDFSSVKKMMIDESSLLYVGEKQLIRKIENNVVKKYPVKVGLKRQGQVEILEGLSIGDSYVSRSNGYLVDGDKVKVIKK